MEKLKKKLIKKSISHKDRITIKNNKLNERKILFSITKNFGKSNSLINVIQIKSNNDFGKINEDLYKNNSVKKIKVIKRASNIDRNLYSRSIFGKINESIDKIKDLTNRNIEMMKKNIKIIDDELSQSKLNFKNYNSFNSDSFFKDLNKNKNKFTKRLNINKFNFNKTFSNKIINSYSNKNLLNNNNKFSMLALENNINENEKNYILNSSTPRNMSPINYNNIIYNSPDINSDKKIKISFLEHHRNFNIDGQVLRAHAFKVFNISPILMSQSYFIKEQELQLQSIMDKIKLIIDNIEYFKQNYMNNNNFHRAFKNMKTIEQSKFNLIMEEICTLILKLVPLILKNYNYAIEKLLFIGCPDITKESLNIPFDETECLYMNYNFLMQIMVYFNTCVKLFKVIQKKIAGFKYDINEFTIINIYLDLARFNSSSIICISNANIQNIIKDESFLEKIKLKRNSKYRRQYKKSEDILERYHRRHKRKIDDDILKLKRINKALNLKNKVNQYTYYSPQPERKVLSYTDRGNKPNLLNSHLIKSMMKYFNKSVKNKIISEQIIERYKSMEFERIHKKNEGNIISDF